jgi:hypothetical protein
MNALLSLKMNAILFAMSFFWVVVTIPLSAQDSAKAPPASLTIKKSQSEVTVTQSNPTEIIEDIKNAKDWTDLINLQTGIYTLLITLGGYLSYLIPGLKEIDSGTYRVLTFAVIVIAGGAVLGLGDIWQGAISYLFSTSLYEVILKWLVKSPKPDVGQ